MSGLAAWASTVRVAEVTFRWTVAGDVLEGEVSAPTEGWVAVGLNDRPGLDGSLLVLGAVHPDGSVRVEEHVARPPRHPRRAEIGGQPGLLAFSGAESGGSTTIRFTLRLLDDGVVTPPSDRAWITLAWSHEDDFDHHSAWRTEVASRWPSGG